MNLECGPFVCLKFLGRTNFKLRDSYPNKDGDFLPFSVVNQLKLPSRAPEARAKKN